MLLPVCGLVLIGDQAMADRYTYLPLIGIFIALGLAAAGLAGPRRGEMGVGPGSGDLLVLCAAGQLPPSGDTGARAWPC